MMIDALKASEGVNLMIRMCKTFDFNSDQFSEVIDLVMGNVLKKMEDKEVSKFYQLNLVEIQRAIKGELIHD